MARAIHRATVRGETALHCDRAAVREGFAFANRQGRALRDKERLALVQRCIAKQCRIADDRAGIAVEKNTAGDAAVVIFTAGRFNPGTSYGNCVPCTNTIRIICCISFHNTIRYRNLVARENSYIIA